MELASTSPHLEKRTCWQSWANVALGVWVFATPWLTGVGFYKPSAAMNFWIVGAVISALAIGAVFSLKFWEQGINFALGIWIAISPWIFHFHHVLTPLWNAIVVGTLIAICAGASAPEGEKLREILSRQFVSTGGGKAKSDGSADAKGADASGEASHPA